MVAVQGFGRPVVLRKAKDEVIFTSLGSPFLKCSIF
jgi:hypothetical protein